MVLEILPNVQYYEQKNPLQYCGAACAKMLLEAIGGVKWSQDDLSTEITNNSLQTEFECSGECKVWDSAPDGLTKTINKLYPSTFQRQYALCQLKTDTVATRRLIWSIHRDLQLNAPQIALLYGVGHWLIVEGYEASRAPTGPYDGDYDIQAIHVKDPGAELKRVIQCQNWLDDLWSVCDARWVPDIVTVCSSDGTEGAPPLSVWPRCLDPQLEKIVLSEENQIIPPVPAVGIALEGVRNRKLYELEGWRQALASATPMPPDESQLVQRLDRVNRFYYMVPFVRDGVVTMRALVDATSGAYTEAGLPGPRSVYRIGTSRDAANACLGRSFEIGRRRLVIPHPAAVTVYRNLVWKPCVESMSPYMPFYLVFLGEDRLYVRLDGQIFTALHEDLAGM